MRRTAITIIVGLVVLGIASPSEARSRHKTSASCLPGRGHVLVADTEAQVYVASNSLEQPQVYGCLYGRKNVVDLGPREICGGAGSEGECFGVENPAVAGTKVAYLQFNASGSHAEWRVVVRDLLTGRVLRKIPTGTRVPAEPREIGTGPTTMVVVKGDGAVAWIVITRGRGGREPAEYEVHAVDKNGSRVLATGPGIASESLALVGSTLYWTQEGKPFSATLK